MDEDDHGSGEPKQTTGDWGKKLEKVNLLFGNVKRLAGVNNDMDPLCHGEIPQRKCVRAKKIPSNQLEQRYN